MPDLFDYDPPPKKPEYPDHPGFKEPTTSKAAADAVAPRALSLRDRALELLRMTPLTPDETADALGVTVLAMRPRFTELKLMGKIVRTGEVRKNISGMKADVWRVL